MFLGNYYNNRQKYEKKEDFFYISVVYPLEYVLIINTCLY